jgi:hypothetical protein
MNKFVGFAVLSVVGLTVAACEFNMRAGTNTAAAVPAAVTPDPAPNAGGVAAVRTRMIRRRAIAQLTPNGGTPTTSSGGPAGPVADAGPAAPAEAPLVTATTVFGGSTADAESFMGNIFLLPASTTQLPDFTKLVPVGSLFTKTFTVAEGDFTGGFPGVTAQSEFFGIAYDGPLAVTKDAFYEMRLVSDDGARVLIEDSPILSNDGIKAGKTEVTGPVHLKPGVYALHVEYFQAAKPKVAFQLYIGSKQLGLAERALTSAL